MSKLKNTINHIIDATSACCRYGGYDIILIKLQEAARGHGTACIPAKHFDHALEGLSPMIGGYGRYRRVPCETNDRGPEVRWSLY